MTCTIQYLMSQSVIDYLSQYCFDVLLLQSGCINPLMLNITNNKMHDVTCASVRPLQEMVNFLQEVWTEEGS